MADRDRHNFDEEERLVGRLREWYRDRVRNRDPNKGYYRDRRDYGHDRRDFERYRDQQRGGYRSANNHEIHRDYNHETHHDYNRDFDRDYGSDYGSNRDQDAWERTRQWRSRYDRNQENQGGYVDRYGQGQQRYGSGWGTDRDFEYGLGRDPYDEENNRYGYNRYRGYGWDQSDDDTGDYHRDFFSNRGRDPSYPERQTGYSRDYGSDWGEYSNRGFRDGYPSAGMGADYGGRSGSRNRDEDDEDVNYGEGDVGYESEGAFYQDMDEPTNYRANDYQRSSGEFRLISYGPRDYQRSDERINEDVNERLTRHGRVDASNIEVEVKNGEVFLKGSVPDRQMKRLAEDISEDIYGVKDVHNEIKIDQHAPRAYSYDTRQYNRDRVAQQDWQARAETGPAGQSNTGEGFETGGATSMEGLESIQQQTPNPQGTKDAFESTAQMTFGRQDLREGMEVIGSNGSSVGKVKEIRVNDFLVDRELARDVYVPYSAITSAGEQIQLNIPGDEVHLQGWEKPPIM